MLVAVALVRRYLPEGIYAVAALAGLPRATWERLGIWMALGLVLYGLGRRKRERTTRAA